MMGTDGRTQRWVVVLAVAVLASSAGVTATAAQVGPVDDVPLTIVHLGDSYSSGNGARDEAGNRSYHGPRQCYRSPDNWGNQYAGRLQTAGYRVTYVNRACSGAVTANILGERVFAGDRFVAEGDPCPPAEFPDDERYVQRDLTPDELDDFGPEGRSLRACDRNLRAQIEAVNDETDIVVLTGGGNDVGFSSIVQQCFALAFRDPGDCRENVEAARAEIDNVRIRLDAVLRSIRERAGDDVRVLLVGYPYLSNRDDFELVYRIPPVIGFVRDRYVAGAEVRRLGDQGDDMQAAVVDAANAEAGFDFAQFVELKELFAGREPNPDTTARNPDRWIREFIDSRLPVEWYHYNEDGHEAIGEHLFDRFGAAGVTIDDRDLTATIDLVFVIDTTASMSDEIDGVRSSIREVLARLEAASASWRVAVVDYRDHPSRTRRSEDYPSRLQLDFSSDNSAVEAAIDGLTLGSGGDTLETIYSGFMTAFELSWRPGVKKVAIQIGDAGPLDPEPVTELTAADIIATSMEVDPVAVYALDRSRSPALRQIADRTGGRSLVLGSPEEVGDQIAAIVLETSIAPSAWIGESYIGRVGDVVTFDGRGSYDPNGTIVLWEWDFDSDGVVDLAGPDASTVDHVYDEPYSGLVSLRVTDNDGNRGSASARVLVDADGDGVASDDNCPMDANHGQEDTDLDGTGDACDSDTDDPNVGGDPAVEGRGTQAVADGYWMIDRNGQVYEFGGAPDLPDVVLRAGTSAAELVATPSGEGFWVLDTDGVVHVRGDATHHGDLPTGTALLPGEVPATLSHTPSGLGYWIFTSVGRAVAFGDATDLGDLVELGVAALLNGPVVDAIALPDGTGYYMVASDGGVFAFGAARFRGSMGGRSLNEPVIGLVPDPEGSGYWLVASDGGVFAFDAGFRGSVPGLLPSGAALRGPIVGMVPYGSGYVMVGSDGGAFVFSELEFFGSLGDRAIPAPIVSLDVSRT